MKKWFRKTAVAIATAVLFVTGAGVAEAHTSGAQTISAVAYAPSAGSLFVGTADTNCTNGAYGNACETENRVVKVTPQARYCGNPPTCSTWTSWTNLIPEQNRYCNQESAPKGPNCSNNATTLILDTDTFGCPCIGSILWQYRTRVKAGYVNSSGTWSFTSYKYSEVRAGTQCDAL